MDIPRRLRLRLRNRVNSAAAQIKQTLARHLHFKRGQMLASSWPAPTCDTTEIAATSNDLERFFNGRTSGRGIWKWRHYFPIYDRHFARFRGQCPHVLEIGVYSGGSLDMWRDYFGPGTAIFSIDIMPECRVYEAEDVHIFIGDQSDPEFWAQFKRAVPRLDIVIDDGSHIAEHQMITVEQLLPYLSPSKVCSLRGRTWTK